MGESCDPKTLTLNFQYFNPYTLYEYCCVSDFPVLRFEISLRTQWLIIVHDCRLMNLGNTCYMNVIVQILCNLPSFVNGMERFFGPLVNLTTLEVSSVMPRKIFPFLFMSFLLSSSV